MFGSKIVPTCLFEYLTIDVKGTQNYSLFKKTTTPQNVSIHPFILDVLEKLGQGYLDSLEKKFSTPVEAVLVFSLEKGLEVISSTDTKINGVVDRLFRSQTCAVTHELGLMLKNVLPLKDVDEETVALAKEDLKDENPYFFDFIGMNLMTQKLSEPISVKLILQPTLDCQGCAGLTTAIFRFPICCLNSLPNLTHNNPKGSVS